MFYGLSYFPLVYVERWRKRVELRDVSDKELRCKINIVQQICMNKQMNNK